MIVPEVYSLDAVSDAAVRNTPGRGSCPLARDVKGEPERAGPVLDCVLQGWLTNKKLLEA